MSPIAANAAITFLLEENKTEPPVGAQHRCAPIAQAPEVIFQREACR